MLQALAPAPADLAASVCGARLAAIALSAYAAFGGSGSADSRARISARSAGVNGPAADVSAAPPSTRSTARVGRRRCQRHSHSSHKSVESGETRKIVPHLAHCRGASECAGSVTARRGVDCAFVRLRIAQWRLALARQESQINPGHLEAENSRSHPEHRMAGSLYGSRVARQLDPGGTLRAFRPFVKGSA